jgi:CHRD domain-containing protein
MRKAGMIAFLMFVALATAPGHAQRGGVSVFSATLAGENEVPLVSSPATGTFRADIDEDAQEVRYELSYSGFTTEVRQAHIHIAQPFASGSIMVWLCDSATNPAPSGVTVERCPQGEGSVSGIIHAADAGTGSAAQGVARGEFGEFIAAIRSGNAYANVHSAQSTGGEIRGQLKPGDGPK